MTDQELMAQIKVQMGATIRATAADGMEAFTAALVANESSGGAAISRFEPNVLGNLAQVLAGRKPSFGSIIRSNLSVIVTKAGFSADPIGNVVGLMLDLATSWGPTQIMGYQTIGMGVAIEDLKTPSLKHFMLCGSILKAFMREWTLQPTESENLFRCWNTGRPNGETTDPDYVAKGLSRMAIYAGLP